MKTDKYSAQERSLYERATSSDPVVRREYLRRRKEVKNNLLRTMLLASMKLDPQMAVENAMLYEELLPDDYAKTLEEMLT